MNSVTSPKIDRRHFGDHRDSRQIGLQSASNAFARAEHKRSQQRVKPKVGFRGPEKPEFGILRKLRILAFAAPGSRPVGASLEETQLPGAARQSGSCTKHGISRDETPCWGMENGREKRAVSMVVLRSPPELRLKLFADQELMEPVPNLLGVESLHGCIRGETARRMRDASLASFPA